MQNPYALGALHPDHHERIVADLEGFAQDAGIQPQYICSPLGDFVTDEERDYLKGFRRQAQAGCMGLVLTGKNESGQVEARMASYAGALVRNFIRAKVITLGTTLDLLAGQDMPEIGALLIPNFFTPSADAGTIATWQVSALYDYLVYRQLRGAQTILYAQDLNLLGKEYGMAFKRHLEVHFKIVKV